MKPIAIFYHCRLSGGDPPIQFGHASQIMVEQMDALNKSGVAEAAQKIFIGVNGGEPDYFCAGMLAPEKAEVFHHPEHYRGELPTLFILQEWARKNPDWHVLYHHSKGALHTGDVMYAGWRRCMERAVVWNWKHCTMQLEAGLESIGAHWMTPEKWPGLVKSPFWGGNFWWATSDFINTLPQIRQTATCRAEFYDAESWIGWGPRRPRVEDLHAAFPGATCSQ